MKKIEIAKLALSGIAEDSPFFETDASKNSIAATISQSNQPVALF